MCDMVFKCRDTINPRDASKEILMTATAATLRLSNQKNEIRASLIHFSACGSTYCPVIALVRTYLYQHDNNDGQDTIICPFGITWENDK